VSYFQLYHDSWALSYRHLRLLAYWRAGDDSQLGGHFWQTNAVPKLEEANIHEKSKLCEDDGSEERVEVDRGMFCPQDVVKSPRSGLGAWSATVQSFLLGFGLMTLKTSRENEPKISSSNKAL